MYGAGANTSGPSIIPEIRITARISGSTEPLLKFSSPTRWPLSRGYAGAWWRRVIRDLFYASVDLRNHVSSLIGGIRRGDEWNLVPSVEPADEIRVSLDGEFPAPELGRYSLGLSQLLAGDSGQNLIAD